MPVSTDIAYPRSERIPFNGEQFEYVDALTNINVADSFVKSNKTGKGSGEARLYIGNRSNPIYDSFFNKFPITGVILKRDLVSYMTDAYYEYLTPTQNYNRKISESYKLYVEAINNLPDITPFSVNQAFGSEDNLRYYIRSLDAIYYDLFRDLLLPIISSIYIVKLSCGTNSIFRFVPILVSKYNQFNHPAVTEETKKEIEKETKNITITEREQIIKSRIGQGDFRNELIINMSCCPITQVDDIKLLIASHIKPWRVSDNNERLNKYNGLLFTPTYDKLFDHGYISFDSTGVILCSPLLSMNNYRRLGMTSSLVNIPDLDQRNQFLEYHRANVFKR